MSANQDHWSKLTNCLLKFAVEHCLPGDRLFACYWWHHIDGDLTLKFWWKLNKDSKGKDVGRSGQEAIVLLQKYLKRSNVDNVIAPKLYVFFSVVHATLRYPSRLISPFPSLQDLFSED